MSKSSVALIKELHDVRTRLDVVDDAIKGLGLEIDHHGKMTRRSFIGFGFSTAVTVAGLALTGVTAPALIVAVLGASLLVKDTVVFSEKLIESGDFVGRAKGLREEAQRLNNRILQIEALLEDR